LNDDLDLAGLLSPGMQVFVGGGSNEPVALLERLAATPECAAGVTFTQFPLPGLNRYDLSVLADGARFKGKIDTKTKSTGQRPAVPPAPPKAFVEV